MKKANIYPCSSGFGEYECGEFSEITEIALEILEQEGWEKTTEIDGKIHNQPDEIWKLKDDVLGVQYCGVLQ